MSLALATHIDPAIRIRGVSKRFGDVQVLDNVDLDVEPGEIACLIGPSGSGKSTLLRCINALAPVDAGSVVVGGVDVAARGADIVGLRRRVGVVFQSYNLFPHMTVLENIVLGPTVALRLPRGDAEARAMALLDRVRLAHKASAYPAELSGGQQQRVAIARSLAMQPEVMMFDEVTAALDPEMVKEVLATIRDVAAAGMTCIIVTHELRFAREIGDRIHVLVDGKIVESGSPAKIFQQPATAQTRWFLDKML